MAEKMNLLAELKKSNKLFIGATQVFRELDPDLKLPEGVYECKISEFKFDMIKDMFVLKRIFLIIKSGTGEFDGFTMKDTMFMTNDRGQALVREMCLQFGATEVKDIKSNEDLVPILKKLNKNDNLYALDLVYGKTGWPNIKFIRQLESIDAEITEPAIAPEEIIDDFAEPQEVIEDIPPFESEEIIPDIPELQEEKSANNIEKHLKKLKAFVSANDIEIPNLKRLTAEEIVDQIKTNVKEGFTDLEKTEKTLLKNVGLIHLVR